jgi:hypothetical protein
VLGSHQDSAAHLPDGSVNVAPGLDPSLPASSEHRGALQFPVPVSL